MFDRPDLTPGYSTLPAWHRSRGYTSYELNRVYDANNRLRHDLSFWWAIPQDQGDQPRTRFITYEECRRLPGNRELSFAEFSSAIVPLDEIESWISAARECATREQTATVSVPSLQPV
jgi:hypothetical protein